MAYWAIPIWVSSIVLLLLMLAYELIRTRRNAGTPLLLQDQRVVFAGGVLFMIVVFLAILYFDPPGSDLRSGGASATPWGMVALMYLAMSLGIVAQSYYFADASTLPLASSWLKPMLASPLIFVPLLSSYQSSLVNISEITLADLMILLVSFQNGFFWKVVFDKQAESVLKRREVGAPENKT